MKSSLLILLIGCVVTINGGEYTERFLDLYNKIHSPSSGYFSPQGVPYHSRETLMVESVDHGHETTSEAYSFYIWLEAMYGAVSGQFTSFNTAWDSLEKYIIPTPLDQQSNIFYDPSHPSSGGGVSPGHDPLYQELVDAYNTSSVYGMHWISDADNVYGFGNSPGNCETGPNTPGPSYFNNYAKHETVWETVPYSTCDAFKYGASDGFLGLLDNGNITATPHGAWTYTCATDADARAISAAYWASLWASSKGQLPTILNSLSKAAKLGDYLRYGFYDKYFKTIGSCTGGFDCEAATGKESADFLLNWVYRWGGSIGEEEEGSAWRYADSNAFFGYQNPVAAYALVNDPNMRPLGVTAVQDWETSLERQLELYSWLQSEEGAFGAGVTNSWNNEYDTPPANVSSNTFHGMFYNWKLSTNNFWYGFQAWSVDRLAQYYYITGDTRAKTPLDKWVSWVISSVKFDSISYQVPNVIEWSGVPGNLHATIVSYTNDVGTAAPTARALAYYAARSNDNRAQDVAKRLLDLIWANYQTPYGVSSPETVTAYSNFNHQVVVPPGWSGVYPNGDLINSTSTFIGIRSWYRNDPDWPKVEAYLNGGDPPTFTYHRFWSQVEIAVAFGAYGLLFD